MLKRGNLRYLFIGDNILSDVYICAKSTNWETLLILEELLDYEEE
jgi:ribonucleotide monophosphatase NagD (HAD superfamily)